MVIPAGHDVIYAPKVSEGEIRAARQSPMGALVAGRPQDDILQKGLEIGIPIEGSEVLSGGVVSQLQTKPLPGEVLSAHRDPPKAAIFHANFDILSPYTG